MRYTWFILLLIVLTSYGLTATNEIDPEIQQQMLLKAVQTITDSLAQLKELEIHERYGFLESNTLQEVAEKLQIADFARWKRFLDLDPANEALNAKSLRKLGISPYRAQLAYESAVLGFNELNTVSEVSSLLQVPIKKFKQLTISTRGPLDRSMDHMTLQALQLNPKEVKRACDIYQENRMAHGLSITLVGMLIVFSALVLTSIIISQLHRVNIAPTAPVANIIKVNPQGQVTDQPQNLSSNVIIAAITALHLHINSIAERRRLILTFKRASVNLWHASRVTELPNFRFMKRGK